MPIWMTLLHWSLCGRAERALARLAAKAPHWLRYRLVIDAWAKSTSGQYGTTNPLTLTVDEMVQRLEASPSDQSAPRNEKDDDA